MKVYICVDDTDDLTKSTSTGKIADLIAKAMVSLGATIDKGVTRHQLLLHDDIEYTSHNSSMCMVIDIDGVEIAQMKEAAEKILKENMAESSDPGLCFCRLDQLKLPDQLIAYGKKAQQAIISKEEAYALADELGGTVLQEYGGTGIGVIGALAGVGLRLSGCDGTFRGGKGEEYAGQTRTVKDWQAEVTIEQVVDLQGNPLDGNDQVEVKDQIKLAMIDHKKTLVVKDKDGKYVACKKKDLYNEDKKVNYWTTNCDKFELDNDAEECYTDEENACYNCLYRRWTATGYICRKQGE